jgi:hypothetical protein
MARSLAACIVGLVLLHCLSSLVPAADKDNERFHGAKFRYPNVEKGRAASWRRTSRCSARIPGMISRRW